jgi:hypothetical protein
MGPTEREMRDDRYIWKPSLASPDMTRQHSRFKFLYAQ